MTYVGAYRNRGVIDRVDHNKKEVDRNLAVHILVEVGHSQGTERVNRDVHIRVAAVHSQDIGVGLMVTNVVAEGEPDRNHPFWRLSHSSPFLCSS